jgi:hypothetical protein
MYSKDHGFGYPQDFIGSFPRLEVSSYLDYAWLIAEQTADRFFAQVPQSGYLLHGIVFLKCGHCLNAKSHLFCVLFSLDSVLKQMPSLVKFSGNF